MKPPNGDLLLSPALRAIPSTPDAVGLMHRSGTVYHAVTATLPSPTMVRTVSGSDAAITKSHVPEQMTRNQNIDRQPRLALRAAAITGPTLGAEFVLVPSAFQSCFISLGLPKCDHTHIRASLGRGGDVGEYTICNGERPCDPSGLQHPKHEKRWE